MPTILSWVSHRRFFFFLILIAKYGKKTFFRTLLLLVNAKDHIFPLFCADVRAPFPYPHYKRPLFVFFLCTMCTLPLLVAVFLLKSSLPSL